MNLVKGADVYSAEGEKIGSLSRVVIDPRTRKVTHIVIEKGVLFTSNKIVPIDKITPENEKMIILTSSKEEADKFEDFEQAHYVNLDSKDLPEGEAVETSYWYPPVDYAWWRSGMLMSTPPMPIYTLRATQNIPDGTVALEEGASVISADGEQVGHIEQLIVEPQDNRVTHFVVSAGFFSKERRLIPVVWIDTLGEQSVHLSVNAGTLERLPAYHRSA